MAEPSSTARRDQIVVALIGAIAVLVAAAIPVLLSMCATSGPIKLTIISPQNGGTVKSSDTIRVRVSGTLQPEQEAWVVIDSLTDGRRYPQGACQLFGETEAACTGRFGKQSQESVGRSYIITAVIINSIDAPILTPLKDGGYPIAGPVPAELLVQSPTITVKRV